MSLSPKHRAELNASGLTDDTIAAAGLYTEADGDKVRELLGNWLSVRNARELGACLAFPYFDPAGEPMTYADRDGRSLTFVRFRPDNPRADKREGRKIKYESPVGTAARAFFPPGTRAAALSDPAVELLITEGEKKALAADQHGFRCIGLGGVWSWQVRREKDERGQKTGPRELIPDLAAVNWQGRRVTVVFDSDLAANKLVQFAEWHLAEQLRTRGADVRVARLPPEPDGAKNGIDDYIVRHGPDALGTVLAAAAEPSRPAADTSNDAPDDPHRLAEKFLGTISPGCEAPSYRVRFWRGDFWRYGGAAYSLLPGDDLQAWLADWVREEFKRVNVAAVKAFADKPGKREGDRPPQTLKVTVGLLRNVTQALRGLCLLPSLTDAPAWIDGPPGPDPAGVLAMGNGLLDLEAAAAGKPGCLLPPDPRFFTTSAVPFAFAPDAPQPVEWLKFLQSLWPRDRDSVRTLQEWFGYLLVPDTRQQKILFLVGPKRGGKGTIARILRELVGSANVAGPTLGSLATNFGLWPLLGKSVALISDARVNARTDTATIVERLLSISGEDALTVDRKHREPLTAKLTARFVILSNEMLRLGDASGALVGRLIVIRATESFYGREDHGLFDRLRAELPGVLRWAIEGWRRLKARGRFVQPASGAELVEDMESLSSPVGAFVRDRCAIGPGCQVETCELYREWKLWCETHGRKEPGTEQMFGAQLRAAAPGVSKSRPRTPEGRMRVYTGIRLQTGSELLGEDSPRGPHAVPDWSLRGPAEKPMNYEVVPTVHTISNISGAWDGEEADTRTPTQARTHSNPVRGPMDRGDHPRCGCGKPAVSRFSRTCRTCLDAEA